MSNAVEILTSVKEVETNSIKIVTHAHHEIHEGSDFFVLYSVADLGAATTPNDTMTLTFTTDDSAEWGHFTFQAGGTAGWRLRLIEAPTGGKETPTGSLEIFNSNRNASKTGLFKDLSGTAGMISFDATLATGGKTLWDEYIIGSSGPFAAGTKGGHEGEIMLMQNTTYQLSLFGTSNDAGTLILRWYEHTD